MNKEDEKKVITTLRAVKEALEEENVVFWLDSGGLLGAVRDGKLIPWDHDVEVGVWEEELPKVLRAANRLRKNEYVIDYLLCEDGEKSIIVSPDKKRKIPVVIEIHVDLGDYAGFGMLIGSGGGGRIREIFRRGLKYLYSIISHPETVGDAPPYVPRAIHIFLYKTFGALSKRYRMKFLSLFNKFMNFLGYRWVYSKVPAHYFRNYDEIEFYGMKFKLLLL